MASEVRAVSLRRNFAWTFAGNVVFGASQWAVLSLVAKLGDREMLGRYALAMAIATPIAMFSHLNLRAVLATDVDRRHPFHDYLAVRLATTVAALLVTVGVAFASVTPGREPWIIVCVGAVLGIDNLSDTYFGLMQRREGMDQIARSLIARGALSAMVLGATLWFTHRLLPAVTAMACARLVVFLAYDRPVGAARENLPGSGFGSQLTILRTALPLGVVLLLVSLIANVPRYAIEHYLGTGALGVFAAVASFLSAGGAVVGALGQSATPRLALYFSRGESSRFRHLAARLVWWSVALGIAGVAGAVLVGRIVLRILYRHEYSAYNGLFVAVMGAGILYFAAIMLGYLLTSVRLFRPQMPLLGAAAGVCVVASWIFVPLIGLEGAAVALALASAVQIAGAVFVLRGAMSRI